MIVELTRRPAPGAEQAQYEYVPVTGDPGLVIDALAKLVDRHRDSAPEEEEVPDLAALKRLTKTALVKLAKTVKCDAADVQTAKLAADGQHSASLYALFSHFVDNKALGLTEQGFHRILTKSDLLVGGQQAKPNDVQTALYYKNAYGDEVREHTARHLRLCRILRLDNPADLHIVTERLKLLNTKVRARPFLAAAADPR